jgi:hypothetical protein
MKWGLRIVYRIEVGTTIYLMCGAVTLCKVIVTSRVYSAHSSLLMILNNFSEGAFWYPGHHSFFC